MHGLLARCEVKMPDFGQFLFCVFMAQDTVKAHNHEKEEKKKEANIQPS